MRIRRGNVLFILTGEIQTGKTRWLQGVLGDLSACGVPLRGVVALHSVSISNDLYRSGRAVTSWARCSFLA